MLAKNQTLFLIILFIISCKDQVEDISHLPIYDPTGIDVSNYKTMDFNLYKLKVPNEWKNDNAEGIDSYGARLITTDLETIESDLGWYSYPLDEESSLKEIKIEYFRLNNKKIKIVTPLKSGTGITGVYVRDLWKNSGQMVHFNLYGINLSENSEKELLQVISTIEFKKF